MAFEPIFKMFYKVRKVGKKTGQGTVYVVYRFGQSEMVKTTGVNVLPSEFNTTTGKVSRKNPLHPELNAQIQAVVVRLERAVRNAKGERLEPTTTMVEAYYAKILAQEPAQTSLPGLQYGAESVADLMLQELTGLRESLAQKERAYAEMTLASNLVMGTEDKVLFTDKIAEYLAIHPSYRPATIAGYQDLANMLSKFRPGLSLTDINLALLQSFQAYLLRKELRNQSIRVILSRLKAVYTHFAEDEGLATGFLRKFKLVQELANDNVIFLSTHEIEAIAALEIKAATLHQVQQQFLFACETGLRHSDLYITAANVVGGKLKVTTRKKQKTVTIPLTERAQAILSGPSFPFKRVSINHYNKAVHQICKKVAALHVPVTITHYSGAKTFTETRMKWELVSSHVARKSAINNWLARGVRETVVADWAGHSDLKMLQKHYQNREAASRQEALKL